MNTVLIMTTVPLSELRDHQVTQKELACVNQAVEEMEKDIAALVAQEDYSGAARDHALLTRLQAGQASAEGMEDCLAGSDCDYNATGGVSRLPRTELHDGGHDGQSQQCWVSC